MSFETDVLTMLRHLTDDVECTYTYSDDRLLTLIFVAASYVNMDMGASYTISLANQTISPTPDSTFINLVSMKAACLLLKSIATSYAKQDFKFQDGPASVDLKGISDKIKESANSYCEQYSRSLQRILISGTSGYAVSTPNNLS